MKFFDSFYKNKVFLNSVAGVLFFVLGFTSHYLINRYFPKETSQPLRPGVYGKLTDPLIGIIIPEEVGKEKYHLLLSHLGKYISESKRENKVQDVSVYFRSLKKGEWIAINQDEKFSPASMLKVMVLMAYLKIAEIAPQTLDHKILYDGTFNKNANLNYQPSSSLKSGKFYTVSELLGRMVQYSDNNAVHLLFKEDTINISSLQFLFAYLGLVVPDFYNDSDTISTKEYSRFYRVLYGATYLNQAMSERALDMLTKTNFNDGIVAGIPADIQVAHKFGERSLILPSADTVIKELHDCGIIYYPKNPYFLCVMTRGVDFNILSSFIKEVSAIVYKEVKKFPI